MLLSPPENVGGVPPLQYHALRRGPWYYRGAIVLLPCYRSGTGMARQERFLMASSMRGAKHQGGHRLTVGPASRFGAAIFRQCDLRPSSGKTSKCRILYGFCLILHRKESLRDIMHRRP